MPHVRKRMTTDKEIDDARMHTPGTRGPIRMRHSRAPLSPPRETFPARAWRPVQPRSTKLGADARSRPQKIHADLPVVPPASASATDGEQHLCDTRRGQLFPLDQTQLWMDSLPPRKMLGIWPRGFVLQQLDTPRKAKQVKKGPNTRNKCAATRPGLGPVLASGPSFDGPEVHDSLAHGGESKESPKSPQRAQSGLNNACQVTLATRRKQSESCGALLGTCFRESTYYELEGIRRKVQRGTRRARWCSASRRNYTQMTFYAFGDLLGTCLACLRWVQLPKNMHTHTQLGTVGRAFVEHLEFSALFGPNHRRV